MPCFSSLQRLYREKGENMKHNYTLSGELPEMVQAKLNAMNLSEVKDTSHACTSGSQSVRSISCFSAWVFFFHIELRLYICCVHFQSGYKESWTKIRDGGYKLRLDAIPFQSAKTSAEILSDVSFPLSLLVIMSCHVRLHYK